MIEIGTEGLERAEMYLGGIAGAAERATAKAIGAGLTAARKATVSEITTGYEVKRADVEAHMTIEKARTSAMSGALRLRSGSLPLHYFPHTPDQPGTGGPGAPALQVTVKKGQTKTIPGAFVAPLGGKNRIVIRTGGKTRTGKDALKVFYSIPIPQMLARPEIRLAVEEKAVEAIDRAVTAQIDRELGAVP